MEDRKLIREEAVRCFLDQFTQKEESTNFEMLKSYSSIGDEVDNVRLMAEPSLEEV